MTDGGATSTLTDGTALLERAIGYALGSLQMVGSEHLALPTPCRSWDLRTLLVHMDDSLAALQEAADLGSIELAPEEVVSDPATDLVAALRTRASAMLGAWTNWNGPGPASVGGCPVATGAVTGAGALEIVVHGWDVATACRQPRPLPPRLAEELLVVAHLFVSAEDRPVRFAEPRPVSASAGAGERLLAFLGRT